MVRVTMGSNILNELSVGTHEPRKRMKQENEGSLQEPVTPTSP